MAVRSWFSAAIVPNRPPPRRHSKGQQCGRGIAQAVSEPLCRGRRYVPASGHFANHSFNEREKRHRHSATTPRSERALDQSHGRKMGCLAIASVILLLAQGIPITTL